MLSQSAKLLKKYDKAVLLLDQPVSQAHIHVAPKTVIKWCKLWYEVHQDLGKYLGK